MEEVINSKTGSKCEYRLPINSKEERLDNLYHVLKGDARFFGMDLGKIIDTFYKSMNEHRNQYNGKSKEIDRKRYAISKVEEEIIKFAKAKDIDIFIKSERKFRRNQSKLPLNLERSFRYEHQI